MKGYLILIIIYFSFYLNAQVNLHYFNPEIPQSGYLNPAQTPSCKLIIGIPFLNGIGVQAANNGFTIHQLFIENPDGSLTPDTENILKKIGRSNYASVNIDVSDIYLGYHFKDFYLNFSIRERINFNLFYNKDAVRLALEGNTPFEGQKASARNSGAYLNYMRQYSLGFSRGINESFDFGARVNLLFGKGHMVLKPKASTIYTDEETFGVDIDMDVIYRSSLPFIIEYNDNTDFHYEIVDRNPIDILLNRDNKGISFDLGFIYDYSEDLKIYGSILDLGFINYKRDITNFETNGEFYYNGPPENSFFNQTYLLELANAIDDSIEVSLTKDNYLSFLPAKVYIGGEKIISDIFKVGILLNENIFRFKIQSYLGVHASYQLSKGINTMFSWSYAHRSLKNAGLGFSFGSKAFNFYILSDNITGLIWPLDTKSLNLQFGFNLKFGCNEKLKERDITNECGCAWIKGEKRYRSLIK